MFRSTCLSFGVLICACSGAMAQGGADHSSNLAMWNDLTSRSPWVFLGDSNTYSGGYVAILDAWMDEVRPPVELLNLGVPSETVSGLSEVDHPFKRPCVHERLSKVLAMTRPGVVFICYGMNDGIYGPRSQERFDAYQSGMQRLAAEIHAAGALLVCLTPPIFEPEPVAASGKLGPSPTGRYAYFAPFQEYNEVLREQAQWCLSNEIGARAVIDIHTQLQEEKKRQLAKNASFAFSKDGVHFGSEAHGLIAEQILQSLGAPRSLIDSYPTTAEIDTGTKRIQILRNAYLSATGKNRPGLPAGEPLWYARRLAEGME